MNSVDDIPLASPSFSATNIYVLPQLIGNCAGVQKVRDVLSMSSTIRAPGWAYETFFQKVVSGE